MDIEDIVYNFSVRLVEIVRYFKEEGGGFPLCDMLLDCGVRAGISVRTGNCEAAMEYVWQAVKSGYLTERQGLPVRTECRTLLETLANEGKRQRESICTGVNTVR